MGNEVNLLEALPTKVVRNVAERRAEKEHNRTVALAFGQEYFDGPREQGYGGYRYDGRWVPVADRIIDHFKLDAGSRVLDIGCAKGFLVHDLIQACAGLEAFGLDISDYALDEGRNWASGLLCKGTADQLPFPDNSFDAVVCINTVHNLAPDRCITALREIERLAPGRSFVQVDAYRTEAEKQLFEDWMLTAKTYCSPDGWMDLFDTSGYSGDYYWTILEAGPETIIN